MEATYDIFRKQESGKPPVWIESVAGLRNAKKRLKELAAKKPGEYLLWDATKNKFIRVD